MVKNKKVTYVLIGLVAAVWGVIFYRIFAQLDEEEPPVLNQSPVKGAYFNLKDHKLDSFTLAGGYADPFGEPDEELVVSTTRDVNTGNTSAQVMPTPKPMVNWPNIVYSGRISNPGTKQDIVILNINGKETMMQSGESISGVKLLKQYPDSIKVGFMGQTRYLRVR